MDCIVVSDDENDTVDDLDLINAVQQCEHIDRYESNSNKFVIQFVHSVRHQLVSMNRSPSNWKYPILMNKSIDFVRDGHN